MEGEHGHIENTVDTGTLWASSPLGDVYLLWRFSQSIILMMAQRLPLDLMSVLGFVFVMDKCTLLTCPFCLRIMTQGQQVGTVRLLSIKHKFYEQLGSRF